VTGCDSPQASSTTIELVRNALIKAVARSLSTSGTSNAALEAKIRATVAQLGVTLEDVRTDKRDPSGSRVYCRATLRVKFPGQLLTDADGARSDAQLPSISDLAETGGVQRSADVFGSEFTYNVQPTDAGDKIFVESDDWAATNGVFSEIVASGLLKAAVEQRKIQTELATAAQQQQEQAAKAEQRSADHQQALTENQLANQTIAALWKNLDIGTRTALLEDQRAWIRKKTADCDVEAAGASVETTEQDTARLKCDTRMTQERISLLKQKSTG
jgi:uncharacterized protein YecT (DUF1311 family)